ncbi:MAG: LytTR family DNA-binding domain-containing protein [Acutalibacteraceae bacterium]|nr:LytTR family DNA-binding domain-containing protein [Acutalibacteraceae bacterium]
MRIGICDSNLLDREIITDFLNDYFYKKSIEYSICSYSSGKELIYDIQDGKNLDLIFLDIYIGNEFGISIAKQLREKIGYDGKIVFLTATVDFAVDSYDVEAVGYLLKPVHTQKLHMVMNKITKNLDAEVYRIKQRNNIHTLKIDSIIYVESSNSRCIIHSYNTDYVIYKRLNDIEAELNNRRFLRCHQSYLVNMDYIKNVDKQFELVNGDFVCIRQRNLKAIKQQYVDYIKSKII